MRAMWRTMRQRRQRSLERAAAHPARMALVGAVAFAGTQALLRYRYDGDVDWALTIAGGAVFFLVQFLLARYVARRRDDPDRFGRGTPSAPPGRPGSQDDGRKWRSGND